MNQPEIRMIVCDVDGTLLKKGAPRISNSVFSAIKTATDAGIKFVIASGRCYQDLSNLFAPVLDLVTFICSDGALAVKNGTTLFSAPIEKQLAADLILACGHEPESGVVINCKNGSYSNKALAGLSQVTVSEDLSTISEAFCKIAFYGLSDFAKYKVRSFAERSGKLTEVYADVHWTEFVTKNTDKGAACSALQAQWGISPFETVAFGDNTNDFGMLRRARVTFATSTAIYDIKKMCKYCTDNIPGEIIKISQGRGTL